MSAKLRHIAISVPDLKPAAEFYKKTFGLEEVNYVETPYGDGRWMACFVGERATKIEVDAEMLKTGKLRARAAAQ